jgi:hypothetical protein
MLLSISNLPLIVFSLQYISEPKLIYFKLKNLLLNICIRTSFNKI